jgi:adhesin transport system outer membrane protein
LDLQARKNLGTSSDGQNSNAAADVLELTMNFNLFNGFSDRNLVRQTAEKLNSSRDLRDKACVDTRQVVSIAYNDINQLQVQRSYREKHTVSIENAREAYRKQFDIGQRTLLDLLDTENEYFQSKRSLANTQYDMQIAYARVYAGQGELLRKIGAARGNLPEYSREEYVDAETVCQAVAPVQITVDKEALLADAKPLSSTYASLAKPLTGNKIETATSVASSVCSVGEVTSTVNDWASAWRAKDSDAHLRFYADKFTPEAPTDKTAWVKQRKQTLVTNSNVALKLDAIKVSCDGNKASAKFKQDFKLTSFKSKKVGNNTSCEVCNMKLMPVVTYASNADKELQFERIDNKWQIVRELTSQ